MKSKNTDTVTSNEQLVRLRIFDGEIPLDAAGAELLKLSKVEIARLTAENLQLRKQLGAHAE